LTVQHSLGENPEVFLYVEIAQGILDQQFSEV